MKILRINVHAVDGGLPPLSDDVVIQINIMDENDNAPVFAVCNMTAVVQVNILGNIQISYKFMFRRVFCLVILCSQ